MKAARRRAQRGLGLATALFVITVMALLAVMIFQLVRSNAETTQEEILLTRSFFAAESGLQFGLNMLFRPTPPPGGRCPVPPTVFDFEKSGLSACSASVTCTSVTADSTEYYTITSTGTCGDVSRTIRVRAQ